MSTTYLPKYDVGEIRPSQLLQTFGVGALLDLPHLSVMVMGLDQWNANDCTPIGEERLLVAVQRKLGTQVALLRQPPLSVEAPTLGQFDSGPQIGVPVASFPRWMLCPLCRQLIPATSTLLQLKHEYMRQDKARYMHVNCATAKGTPPTVVPARFLVACEHGHLDDFPWRYFVHRGADDGQCTGILRLVESGVSGEASDIFVRCDTCAYNSTPRPMSDAFGEAGKQNLPACRGRHPHLRDFDSDQCSKQLKTISLGASNSWFGVTLSALSLPEATSQLDRLMEEQWAHLQNVNDLNGVALLRSVGMLRPFSAYADSAIWVAIEARKQGRNAPQPRTLKAPEWQMLSNPGQVPQTRHFRSTTVAAPDGYRQHIRKVVLIERLREVRALLGFTRITSFGDIEDQENPEESSYAPLSRQKPAWIPATEVHGEGIFLQFDEQAMQAWSERPAVAQHNQLFYAAHRRWRQQRHLDPLQGYPSLRYVLLHTFAHALMRQLSLACGYAMASIRERIYALEPTADDGPMAGILLYTAAADSEGTLGGLVNLGQPKELAYHITQALETMHLCASDPLCAEHMPEADLGILHGSACHACMFMPETSCERGNRYLDRSLLVPTLERNDLSFFGGA